jgi:hypothetical protein
MQCGVPKIVPLILRNKRRVIAWARKHSARRIDTIVQYPRLRSNRKLGLHADDRVEAQRSAGSWPGRDETAKENEASDDYSNEARR